MAVKASKVANTLMSIKVIVFQAYGHVEKNEKDCIGAMRSINPYAKE